MDRETRGNALELEIDEVSGNEVFVKSIFYREVSLYPYRVISWPGFFVSPYNNNRFRTEGRR